MSEKKLPQEKQTVKKEWVRRLESHCYDNGIEIPFDVIQATLRRLNVKVEG
jgi:hypothetical protein